MKVFVYFNLRQKLWSIMSLEKGPNKGKVIAHREQVALEKPKPRVSEAGRQRVLKTKQKNVHAGLIGNWTDRTILLMEGDEITYNPYKYSSFVYKDNGKPFTGASLALMKDKQVVVI